MGRSLASGMRASRDASGWVVALADMPFLRPQTIRLIAAGLTEGAVIAAPAFDAVRGHPVGFARRCGDDLLRSGGDEGARRMLKEHPDWITVYDTDDPGVLRDIDTPADL
jgi:molybdenum cofactor cytidylyltransferase